MEDRKAEAVPFHCPRVTLTPTPVMMSSTLSVSQEERLYWTGVQLSTAISKPSATARSTSELQHLGNTTSSYRLETGRRTSGSISSSNKTTDKRQRTYPLPHSTSDGGRRSLLFHPRWPSNPANESYTVHHRVPSEGLQRRVGSPRDHSFDTAHTIA